MHRNKCPQPLLAQLPILALYLLFFIVQVFFNLDTFRVPAGNSQNNHFSTEQRGDVFALSLKKVVHTPSLKVKFRLNKRYEPSYIPYTISAFAKTPVVYVTDVKIDASVNVFYSSIILCTTSLRGPPVVA